MKVINFSKMADFHQSEEDIVEHAARLEKEQLACQQRYKSELLHFQGGHEDASRARREQHKASTFIEPKRELQIDSQQCDLVEEGVEAESFDFEGAVQKFRLETFTFEPEGSEYNFRSGNKLFIIFIDLT